MRMKQDVFRLLATIHRLWCQGQLSTQAYLQLQQQLVSYLAMRE